MACFPPVRACHRVLPGLLLLSTALAVSACEGGRGRPGGPAGSAPPRDAAASDSGSPAGSDAETLGADSGREEPDAEPFNFDAQPTEGDAGFVFPDAELGDAGFVFPDAAADAGVIFPDAAFDAGFDGGFNFPDFGIPPRDASVPRDGGSVDSGPPLQTDVSAVAGTSAATLNAAGTNIEFSVQLAYDNSGPTAETIRVTRAAADPVLPLGTPYEFRVGPDHVAPVGHSIENVSKIPGSGTGTIEPLLVQVVCSFGQMSITLEFSNGDVLIELAPLTCIP